MPKAVRSILKQVLLMLWMIQEAALTILAAAIPMVWVPSVISPLPLRLLQRPLRRLSPRLLFFDEQSFFVVPFGEVDSDVVGNIDVDYATGSFCSSCSIPPHAAGGLWCLKGGPGGDSLVCWSLEWDAAMHISPLPFL